MLLISLAFALGVHVLALFSLRLFTNGDARLRGYGRFVGAVTLWLLLALLVASNVAPAVTRPLAGIVAHFLPLLLYPLGGLPAMPREGIRLAILLAGVALVPFTVNASPLHHGGVETLYYLIAWGGVAFAIVRAFAERPLAAGILPRTIVMAALVGGTLALGLFAGAGSLAAIAFLAALLQCVVLYAIVRLSLYRVRAGAGRSGAIAAAAAEYERHAVAGEIAAMVAHEVRNPLTGVRSLAQRLADDTVDESRRRRYAELIVREVDRVERMVSALLGASARRLASAEGETLLAELFDDVALLVSARYRRAEVTLRVEPSPLLAAAPREPLAQVLLNLLLNAASQAPSGSVVSLSAHAATDDLLDIAVADQGPGIAEEDRSRIFDPFVSSTGGSGLGLAVVRRMCEELEWRIRIEATAGGGATFVLSVPRASASNAARTPVQSRGSIQSDKGGTRLEARLA